MASVSPQLPFGSFSCVRTWGPAFSTTVPSTFLSATKRVHRGGDPGGSLQNDACQSLSSVFLLEKRLSL